MYELLSAAYSEGRYDMMSESTKNSRDWKKLTEEIMEKVFSPLEKSEYETSFALGKTKIMMNAEIREVLEKAKEMAVSILFIFIFLFFLYFYFISPLFMIGILHF